MNLGRLCNTRLYDSIPEPSKSSLFQVYRKLYLQNSFLILFLDMAEDFYLENRNPSIFSLRLSLS